MINRFKIAIFSGTIPSTSFIERLINGVAEHHNVYLFGVHKMQISYSSKSVKIYAIPNSKWVSIIITLLRTLKLLIKQPKVLFSLLEEVKTEKSRYLKFNKFSRCLPILLYKPDILHLQWAKDIATYGFLKTRFKIPMIVSLRGAHINYTPIIEPKYAEIYNKSFKDVDVFHAVSKAIFNEASKYDSILDRTKVIHSPVPKFFSEAFQPYKKSDKTVIKVVSIGRHHWKKGYNYALDAIFQLKNKDINVEYSIIGESAPTEALLFQMHQLGISEQIKFKGQFSQNELLKALKDYDVLLLPSVEEGIANVVIEAMAIGLPVISTDCGGMAEVVKPRKTGWLIPVRNTEAIANAIIDFDNTPESELKALVLNAHQFVTQEFDYEKNIAKFLELYREVLKLK